MQPPIPRGNKKKTVQPVIITTENKFQPKLSERTIKKREEAKQRRLGGGKYASGLDTCGIVCLYVFLVLCVLIGAGGIGVCAYYLNDDSTTVGWKIAGLVLSAIVAIIGAILILLTIFKQARNRPWRRKTEEIFKSTDYYGEMDDDDDSGTNVESLGDDHKLFTHQGSADERRSVSRSTVIHMPTDGKTRETASSPMADPNVVPLNPKHTASEMIFCPGCNRKHPSTHQCMYATRLANGFSVPYRPTLPVQQDSIAIQTEQDDAPMKKKRVPHTVIDRSIKYANTTQTQTDVTANPRSNITESIILRRVPIPTTKVVVQQPTTKVMIVKVPNVAGQLVIQKKPDSTTSEQS